MEKLSERNRQITPVDKPRQRKLSFSNDLRQVDCEDCPGETKLFMNSHATLRDPERRDRDRQTGRQAGRQTGRQTNEDRGRDSYFSQGSK